MSDPLEPSAQWHGPCPLCEEVADQGYPLFYSDKRRPYYRCTVCGLIFVPRPWHLNPIEEKNRYDEHNNNSDDRGYRDFLSRIIPHLEEAMAHLPRLSEADLKGLDFGCGPGPVLAEMLSDRGYSMRVYDPFFHDNPEALQEGGYHFVTSTEVWEHFARPSIEVPRLLALLSERGVLAVMTGLVTDSIDFSKWYYKSDATHICYFSSLSFHWIAEKYDLTVKIRGKDIILLTKKG